MSVLTGARTACCVSARHDRSSPASPRPNSSSTRYGRNARAHGDPFSVLDAWCAHDYRVRLLEYFGDEEGLCPAGNDRLPFEPWAPIVVGETSTLEDLPKKDAKLKVRAVIVEIVEAEGPVHLDRLAQLVAASFGMRRLYARRAAQIVRQARATGLTVDEAGFVWPEALDATSWQEFRPNDSEADRPFAHVSPVEIGNAMRFLRGTNPDMPDADIETATLQTFGRKRRTRQIAAHLSTARALLERRGSP